MSKIVETAAAPAGWTNVTGLYFDRRIGGRLECKCKTCGVESVGVPCPYSGRGHAAGCAVLAWRPLQEMR